MLELKKITKDYQIGTEITSVLKGISLVFRNNEFVSILGPSGCGKTTMLNIIGGLDKYTTGDLIINDISTKKYKDSDWDTYRNHSIGFVFQSYNLIPHQSVLKNVELALSIGRISKKEKRERAIEALTKVGVKDHIKKKPNQLSGGQCQRVAIARAIVTNPRIILADEPTGALDTEMSNQIMEILKLIAKDRLVIMVTHNSDLAEKYSTRIIKMIDGMIINDSNPVKEEEKEELITTTHEKEKDLSQKEKKFLQKKASMSILTSIALSGSNLLTKKKRTFITSLACSIGIIGIAVILSVSNGMQSYVNVLQQDSSSSNFISISNSQSSLGMGSRRPGQSETIELEEYPENTTGVYPYKEETNTISSTPQYLNENYINYIETNINSNNEDNNLVLGISYSKDININMISKKENKYLKTDTSNWSEILNNKEYIETQYTTLATSLTNGSIPTEYNEVVLVVDSYNRISTKILDQLGISYNEELSEIKYEDLLGKEFKLILNDDYYVKETYGSNYLYREINENDELELAYNNGITVKIVSILRQNEDASNTWISTGIGYTEALTKEIISKNTVSEVATYQTANQEYNVLTGKTFQEETSGNGGGFGSMFGSSSTSSYESNLMKLGASSVPSSITIYPKDFDSKDIILNILDEWNSAEIYKIYGNEKDEEGNYIADKYKVKYTDLSELLVSMLGSLIDIITYALVAFSAISLIVSSIMIAIITYASVIERIKEIGTIRSLGGRKRDVSTVFIIEACIIGAISVVIALIVTLLINGLINLILSRLVGVSSIATLSWSTAIWMVILSIGLNLIASLIPSRIAAKKDPVIALRTE